MYSNSRWWPTTNTYMHKICADTGCSLEDLTRSMNDWDGEGESQGTPCYQHELYIYIYIILKQLFLMKQIKHHNVFIYYAKYKSSSVTLILDIFRYLLDIIRYLLIFSSFL